VHGLKGRIAGGMVRKAASIGVTLTMDAGCRQFVLVLRSGRDAGQGQTVPEPVSYPAGKTIAF